LSKSCQQFTYMKISCITGQENGLILQCTSKILSLWNPGFIWFFSFRSISHRSHMKECKRNSVSLRHDWNKCAISSRFRQHSHKTNFSRFFMEQIGWIKLCCHSIERTNTTRLRLDFENPFLISCLKMFNSPTGVYHVPPESGYLMNNDLYKNINTVG